MSTFHFGLATEGLLSGNRLSLITLGTRWFGLSVEVVSESPVYGPFTLNDSRSVRVRAHLGKYKVDKIYQLPSIKAFVKLNLFRIWNKTEEPKISVSDFAIQTAQPHVTVSGIKYG